MPKGKKGVTNPAVRRAMPAKEDAIVGDCLVFINSKITKRKNSPRLYPTNEDTIRYLRHAYATHTLNAGQNPRAIQQSMGHSQLETTMGYLHAEALSVKSPLEFQ